MLGPLEQLIQAIAKLPGIGKKSAARMAFYLLKADRRIVQELSTSIGGIQDKVRECSQCRNYTDIDPCPICQDDGRDKSLLCVVEQVQDLMNLESTREFRGLYHVLHGVIAPLDGIGPDELQLHRLKSRVLTLGVKELILATNPTLEGDTTALYIDRLFKGTEVKITRLASGIPVGGDIEYADRLTIARSLMARRPLHEED